MDCACAVFQSRQHVEALTRGREREKEEGSVVGRGFWCESGGNKGKLSGAASSENSLALGSLAHSRLQLAVLLLRACSALRCSHSMGIHLSMRLAYATHWGVTGLGRRMVKKSSVSGYEAVSAVMSPLASSLSSAFWCFLRMRRWESGRSMPG